MKSIIRIVSAVTVSLNLFISPLSLAQSDTESGWYLKPTLSSSQLSDTSSSRAEIETFQGAAEIALDGGFSAGGILGFEYSSKWASEIGWEYRSNDSQVTLSDGQVFSDGNYASNIIYLNGVYSFDSSSRWHPYLGGGVAWIQEVDVDLEGLGPELSYSGDGSIGFQAFLGINYELNSNWSLLGEVRLARFGKVDLVGEGNSGSIDSLDYNPTSVQIGLKYSF